MEEEVITPKTKQGNDESEILNKVKTYESKKMYIITKEIESDIPSILSYIQSNKNQITNKINIINYLSESIKNIPYNLDLILVKQSNDENQKMNLYEIIINEYIYTEENEKEYNKILKNLLSIIFKKVSYNKDVYRYIFSYVSRFLNAKNGVEKNEISLNEYNYYKVLDIIITFYQHNEGDEPINYFFFNGEENTNITINNTNDNKFDLNTDLYLLFFVKLIDYEYIKVLEDNNNKPITSSNLLKIKFKDMKDSAIINIGYTLEKPTVDNLTINIPYKSFNVKESNYIFMILHYNKEIEIYVNNKRIDVKSYKEDDQKKVSELESLQFFNSFYGLCSTIMVYGNSAKNQLKNFYPKLLIEKYEPNARIVENAIDKDYINGFSKEEFFIPFAKAELIEDVEENNIKVKDINNINVSNDNLIELKKFMTHNLKSLYLPTRTYINSKINTDSEKNKEIVLVDSINNNHAYLNNNELYQNVSFSRNGGVHILSNIFQDLSLDIGGLNHLLPLIEVMTDYNELLSNTNLTLFMAIIPYFLNTEKLIENERHSNFFYYLSLFLERLPGEYFNSVGVNIKSIFRSLESYADNELYSKYRQEFFNHVCLNEKILFKFNLEDRKTMYKVIYDCLAENNYMDVNVNNLINILLYHEKDRYTHFCCKKHASYFKKESKVLEPELLEYIKLIVNIIELLLFNKSKDKTNVKGKQLDINKLMEIFKLLTLDITPCLQITILKLFFDCIKKSEKGFGYFNDNNILNNTIDILFFVYKKSLFDVKELAFEYSIELISKLSNRNDYQGKYIECYATYLYYPKNEEKQESIKCQETMTINKIDYKLIELTENQKKLLSCYDKEHFNQSMKNIFEKAQNFLINQKCAEINLNIAISLASRGDYFAILNLLVLIHTEFQKNEGSVKIILNSNKLLQFLLDTCFQAYLIKNAILNKEEFVPGFSLGECEEEEKKKRADALITKSSNIILNLLYYNIYKLDYLLTWSKYCNQIKEEKKRFESSRKFIFNYFLKKVINRFTDKDTKNNYNLTEKIYLINIVFEYLTFLRFESISASGDDKGIDSLYLEVCLPFIYQLLHLIQDNSVGSFDEDSQYILKDKWSDFECVNKILGNSDFLNLDKDNNSFIDEINIYGKLIHGKKDKFINDLKLLFTNSFNNSTLCNLGTQLIIIKYHYYTLLLTVIVHHMEFKEILNELNSLLVKIIIASSTVSINSQKNQNVNNNTKTNIIWPTQNDYRSIQNMTKVVLFNVFFFLNDNLKKINEKLSKYEKNLTDNKTKELFDNANTIKNYLINTLLYFLQLLYAMYKDVKKEEENKQKKTTYLKNLYNKVKSKILSDKEGIKLTGGYLFIEEFMNNCIIEEKDKNEIQNPNSNVISEKNFLDEIPPFSINSMNTKDYQSSDLNTKLTNIYNSNIQNNERIKQYLANNKDNYQKDLFPFVQYISKRDKLICDIIPSYDNSIYMKNDNKLLCLKPNYIPVFLIDPKKDENVSKLRKNIVNEIRMYQINLDFTENDKIRKYRKIKKHLFSFNGIFSTKKYFYEKKKYICKYRLFNHMTEDYTKLLLTPIIDVDYYLPKYSKFELPNLFRTENKDHLIQITKLANLSLKEKQKKETQKEEKNESDNLNGLYLIKETEFKGIEEINKSIEGTLDHYIFFKNFINKRHKIDGNYHNFTINACFVKLEYHIRGFFYKNEKEIGFYSYDKIPYNNEKKSKRENIDKRIEEIQKDYDPERKSCFGSIFSPQIEKNEYLHITIPFDNIILVLKRRYYMKVSCLEIFTTDKKSYLFKLDHNKLEDNLNEIRNSISPRPQDIYIEYSKFYSKIGFINLNSVKNNMNKIIYQKNYMNLSNIYDKWKNWEISTMRLLMLINIYANRSFHDVNQYPVFPWIITDYKSDVLIPEKNIRPLDTPMGMIAIDEESKQRRQDYLDHWELSKEDDDEEGEDSHERYGSHYSTSLYMSYYLVRVFPFASVRIELQGNNFDDPNRLFNSIRASFNCSITQKSDVRELIPELFCMPEILLNNNDFNLGEIKDTSEGNKGKMIKVEGVEMPKWCNNNPYDFIKRHRKILESYIVSSTINEWLNLIFGVKQKGAEANKVHNLFNCQTYEDYESTFDKMSPDDQEMALRMLEFGITPNQVFRSPASQRKMKLDTKIKNQLFYGAIGDMKSGSGNKNNLIFEEIKSEIKFNDAEKIYYFPKEKKTDISRKNIYIMNNKSLDIYNRKMDRDFILNDKEDPAKYINPYGDDDDIGPDVYEISIKVIEKKEENIILNDFKNSINNKQPINWLDKGTIIVKGGYWNGTIMLKSIVKENTKNPNKINDSGKNIFIYGTKEYSPITKIVIDKNETFALCGNTNGTIYVFEINQNDKFKWTLYKNVNNHNSPISSLAIHENLNIAITCSENGLCMLYSLPYFQLYNSFIIGKDDADVKNDEEIFGPDVVLISDSPLPCFIFYVNAKNCLYFYSINGHLLKKQMLDFTIQEKSIKIYTDYNFIDYLLVYNITNKSIDLYSMIDFQLFCSIKTENKDNDNKDNNNNKEDNSDYNIVVDFILSDEMDHALILFRDEKQRDNYKIYVLKNSNVKYFWR